MSDISPPTTFCTVHPSVEANLRCNRCERPMCTDCAVLTDTGYRCKECIRAQQKVFDTAQTVDYPVAFVIAGVLSLIGSVIAGFLGFWSLFIAPAAGVASSEVVRWAIHRHRSPQLFLTAAAGAALGALPVLLYKLVWNDLWGLIFAGAYAVLVTSSIYYRLRGIRLR